MNYKNIIFETDKLISIIKINRPKSMNAINYQVLEELTDVFNIIDKDNNIKCVILTGEGNKSFIAGADIQAMSKMTPLEGFKFARYGQDLLFFIEKMSKPVIAAVNGFALGGGCEIAMACDFIYASENAKFGQPEINLGIIPGFGGTQRLSRLVGKGLAKELCYTGIIISAQQAKEIGLVNQVLPQNILLDRILKTAEIIANKGSVAIRSIKNLINNGYDLPVERAIPTEAENFALCFSSPDQKEGMQAFLEKRKPIFKSKI